MEPQLLVLDEPFEGLDPSARRGLVELIERLAHEQGVTVVMSTHDIDSVAELADYVYALKPGGEIALRGTPEEVFARADQVAASNIKPPILAELFAGLRARDESAPDVALTVDAAIEAISEWKRCETPS
jgi:cobalt/nickel transport system ATP-binding protein